MGNKRNQQRVGEELGKLWRHKLHEGWWLRIDNTNLGLLGDKCLLNVNKLL